MTHQHGKIVFRVTLLYMLLGCAPHLYAANCLEPSPTRMAGKDPYGPIEVRDLTPGERENIQALLESLAGDWQGTAIEHTCRHYKDPQKVKIKKSTIQAKVEVDYYGNFVLWADCYSARNKSSHKEAFRLYLNKKRLRSHSASSFGDVELIQVSPDRIEFLFRRVLQMSANNSSTHKEYFISLIAMDNTFTLEREIFTQGRLSSKRVWQFSRP